VDPGLRLPVARLVTLEISVEPRVGGEFPVVRGSVRPVSFVYQCGCYNSRRARVSSPSSSSAFLVFFSGCGLGEGRDVRVYNACLTRHPQDVVVCEGPRQAYEVDPAIVQARSADGAFTADYSFGNGAGSPNPPTPPVLLHASPMTGTGPNS
jgi:hypothetical protein